MDIAGAKALKERLGTNAVEESQPAPADVPEDAPPVYHWLGVSQAPDTPPANEDEPSATSASMFRRLGLSFR